MLDLPGRAAISVARQVMCGAANPSSKETDEAELLLLHFGRHQDRIDQEGIRDLQLPGELCRCATRNAFVARGRLPASARRNPLYNVRARRGFSCPSPGAT
jgi:hypothetical protein